MGPEVGNFENAASEVSTSLAILFLGEAGTPS